MDTKENYMQKIDSQIKEVDAKIDLLNAKLQGMEADRKMAYQDDYDRLFREKEDLKNEMAIMESSDESTWEETKDVFEDKWEKFRSSVEDLYERI